jgi:2-polyprenyl-3-methyl-5-hydroxy-6-metoxy-1,4-benzoquinol methylase
VNWDGADYQRRFDELAASGVDVHGEATFVAAYGPTTVLDAGCGTGRVAIELARRDIEVVGVDADASMLAKARGTSNAVEWVLADLATLSLARRFDVVVMAGNVLLFTPKGTEAAVVAGCAAHVGAESILVAGFQLGRGYALADYDAHCRDAGLELAERFGTWERSPFTDGDYAVSVHRRM